MFDIIIPVGPNDISSISNQISYTQKNILNYRNIYLITPSEELSIDGCISIKDSIFPFSLETISDFHGKMKRNGWYLQQLIKLYAGLIVPNLLSDYLVIDADTFFLKPTAFFDNNIPLYNPGTEYHLPYFDHMSKLHQSLVRADSKTSGISHHMVFNTEYIRELISMIENKHDKVFYKVFLEKVDPNHRHGSGASEYEIYFNFMILQHPEAIKIRKLKWANVSTIDYTNKDDHDYVSNHAYMRK